MRASFQHVTVPVTGGIELEAQLHSAKPTDGVRPKINHQEVAIIAHPYGFLGGSLNDHVVQAMKDVLCSRGIPVLLYNSRGVGKSTGRASWTGEPERKDYQAVVDWVANNHHSLPSWNGDECAEEAERMTVYCCGYSYGSVMAGQATSPPMQTGLLVELRYILISPPISSFVGFLLTPFRSAGLATALKRILAEKNPAVPDEGDAPRSQVLIAYGGRDNFTSIATYRQWINGVLSASESKDNKITTKELPEADHFWSNPRCKSELVEVITNWL